MVNDLSCQRPETSHNKGTETSHNKVTETSHNKGTETSHNKVTVYKEKTIIEATN